ncbi:FAD-binding protein, partial [Enterococcus faecium]
MDVARKVRHVGRHEHGHAQLVRWEIHHWILGKSAIAREWAPFCPPSDVFVTSSLSFDAIVIGAGAAGLFCAAQAGQRGLSVLLLDH